jgi:hypothetical protein
VPIFSANLHTVAGYRIAPGKGMESVTAKWLLTCSFLMCLTTSIKLTGIMLITVDNEDFTSPFAGITLAGSTGIISAIPPCGKAPRGI